MAALSNQPRTEGWSEVLVTATPTASEEVSQVALAHVAEALNLTPNIPLDAEGVVLRVCFPIALSPSLAERAAIGAVETALWFAGLNGWTLSALPAPR